MWVVAEDRFSVQLFPGPCPSSTTTSHLRAKKKTKKDKDVTSSCLKGVSVVKPVSPYPLILIPRVTDCSGRLGTAMLRGRRSWCVFAQRLSEQTYHFQACCPKMRTSRGAMVTVSASAAIHVWRGRCVTSKFHCELNYTVATYRA